MNKTDKMLLIEVVFGRDIETLLTQWYVEQRMSDSDIEKFLHQHNIKISLAAIWRWCKQLGITSRSQSTSHKFGEKTPKMQVIEGAMGGQECDKLIPWLWSLGKTSGEIIEFLNGFLGGKATDVLSPRTLSVWLRGWGCRPNEWAKIRQSRVRQRHYSHHPKTKLKISRALKRYFKNHPEAAAKHSRDMSDFYAQHPEAAAKHSRDMSDFYAQHPEARQKASKVSSQVNRQRLAEREVTRFCPLIAENLAESLCGEIQGSDCQECFFYSKKGG